MTDSIDDRLRESLAALSKPVETGEAPSLVEGALAEVESGRSHARAHGPSDAPVKPWHRRIPGGLPALVLASLALVITVGVFMPPIAGARRASLAVAKERDALGYSAQTYAPPSADDAAEVSKVADEIRSMIESDYLASKAVTPSVRTMAAAADAAANLTDAASPGVQFAAELAGEGLADPSAPTEPRTIIRTGSCEIRVEDVEAGRASIESLIRADLGEYVENAAVQLDQSRPAATLTVRIGAGRFDEFVKSLEGIGTLRSLSVNSSDATDQLVDLEARIRNERKVEEEVLGLLANRPDAPLEDIVRVRRELADVRGSIERMEAQRQSILGRAELSTLRITLIGPEPTFSPVDQDAQSFGKRMKNATADGWRTCTDSVVWIAEVIVSGLVWWIAAGAIIWLAVRHHRWTSSWR